MLSSGLDNNIHTVQDAGNVSKYFDRGGEESILSIFRHEICLRASSLSHTHEAEA